MLVKGLFVDPYIEKGLGNLGKRGLNDEKTLTIQSNEKQILKIYPNPVQNILEETPNGLYFIKIFSDKKLLAVSKVIIQH